MKMTTHDFNVLSHMLKVTYDELGGEAFRTQYKTGNFPRADKTKDVAMRYRWDLFWSIPLDMRQPWMSKAYEYLNDTHIDTALKKLAPLT